jgi:DNA-binding NarL/FixJ family response regulator
MDAARRIEHVSSEAPHVLEELTRRQWETISRLLRGERVPAIAQSMYLSEGTVRNHLTKIFQKVGVHSQTEINLLRAP